MGFAAKMTAFWQCDECRWEWVLDSESGPRQCPKCGSRKWNDSIVGNAKLYEDAIAVRHLNRHRRPIGRKTANKRVRRIEVREKDPQRSCRSPDPHAALEHIPHRLG
jgi:hypothetical protein